MPCCQKQPLGSPRESRSCGTARALAVSLDIRPHGSDIIGTIGFEIDSLRGSIQEKEVRQQGHNEENKYVF